MESVTISKDKALLNISLIHEILSKTYWAKGRSKARIIKSIENSICYGVYLDEKQVGFARVISDQVVFAYIMDVFIVPECRAKGFGQKLMKFLLDDPLLQDVKQWHLGTKDAHGLYEKFGFEPLAEPHRWMSLIDD